MLLSVSTLLLPETAAAQYSMACQRRHSAECESVWMSSSSCKSKRLSNVLSRHCTGRPELPGQTGRTQHPQELRCAAQALPAHVSATRHKERDTDVHNVLPSSRERLPLWELNSKSLEMTFHKTKKEKAFISACQSEEKIKDWEYSRCWVWIITTFKVISCWQWDQKFTQHDMQQPQCPPGNAGENVGEREIIICLLSLLTATYFRPA